MPTPTPNPAPRATLVVGLLGGIGAGKSAVAAAFARRGALVLDADALGHEALRQPAVRDAVLARWPQARGPEGEVDRRALAGVVFASPDERRALEALTHPWIRRAAEARVAAARRERAPLVVLDAAVMLEAGWDDVCDKLVFIDAPREQRLARVAARGWAAADLDAREAAQLPLTEKRRRANHVIDNSSNLERLAGQVDDLLHLWGLTPAPNRE